MNEEEFSQYIAPGHEQRSIEYKGAGPRKSKLLLAKVVKAAMGLANTRDGGVIIIGIDEDGSGKLLLTGLSKEDLPTWNFDELSDSLAEYSDPTVSFDIEVVIYREKSFVVLRINEFDDTPIVCKKYYPDVLRAGACYVRPRRKPETTEPPSHADMIDLLALATEKGIRRFLSQARTAGINITENLEDTDKNHFNTQIQDLLNPDKSSAIVKKILSRGYWVTRISPRRYKQNRIANISALLPLLQRISVRRRGWYYPHLDSRQQNQIGLDYVGQESEWEHMLSSWRFYQSGLFIHVSGIPTDWRDQSSFWPPDGNWKQGQLLGIGETIGTLSEVLLLASRLATSDAGDENIVITIELGNINNRILYVDENNRWPLDSVRSASIIKYPIEIELNRSELVANSKTIALQLAIELFKRFGFDTTIDILRSWQDKLNI